MLDEDGFFTLPGAERADSLTFEGLDYDLAVVEREGQFLVLHIAAKDLQSSQLLLALVDVDCYLGGDGAGDVVPDLELELLSDGHHLLLVVTKLLDEHDLTAVLVHILDALVVLEVPDLDVALGDRHQDVRAWDSVDVRHLILSTGPICAVLLLAFGVLTEPVAVHRG